MKKISPSHLRDEIDRELYFLQQHESQEISDSEYVLLLSMLTMFSVNTTPYPQLQNDLPREFSFYERLLSTDAMRHIESIIRTRLEKAMQQEARFHQTPIDGIRDRIEENIQRLLQTTTPEHIIMRLRKYFEESVTGQKEFRP